MNLASYGFKGFMHEQVLSKTGLDCFKAFI